MIDLRQEFYQIMQKWGHNVMLQRWRNNIYSDKLEQYTVRHVRFGEISLPSSISPQDEGLMRNVDLLYYFQYEAFTHEQDRIYEEDPRYASGYATFIVAYAVPMRGKGGRIEFWVCGVNREVPS